MSHLRAFFVAISTALLLAVTAGSAAAASSVSVGSSTVSLSSDTTVVGPQTRAIIADVRIETGKKGLRVALNFGSSTFIRYIARRPVHEGSPLRYSGIDSISGPVTVFGSGGGSEGGLACGVFSDPVRGESVGYASYDIQVPARSSALIKVRLEIVGDAPWANTDYSPRILVSPLDSHYGPSRQTNPREWDYFHKRSVLSLPRPTIALPLAARVDLDISPQPNAHFWGLGPVPAGKPLKLTATLVPKRVGYPIELWINRTRVKKTFVTDENGQITHSFTPRYAEPAMVRAAFPGLPGGDLLPDRGCLVNFDVAKPRKGQK